FKPEEYWKVTALLAPAGTLSVVRRPSSVVLAQARKATDSEQQATDNEPRTTDDGQRTTDKPEVPPGAFQAELAEWAGKKFAAGTEEAARAVAAALDDAAYVVAKVEQKDRQERAPAP